MDVCKHGLKQGCYYCHGSGRTASRTPVRRTPAAPRGPGRTSKLSEQMNDRMTALKRRLKELRGE